jgi:hypothetical protein
MRIKLISIIAILLIIFLIIFIIFFQPKLSTNNIQFMTITSLPSPPQTKTVNNKEDIKAFVDLFNSIKLHPALDFSKGWIIKIDINNTKTILISQGRIVINNISYHANNEIVNKINEYIKNLK